jgi:gliding motility-associated-like protein
MKQLFTFINNGDTQLNRSISRHLGMKTFLILFSSIICLALHAQTPDNNWVFGFYGQINFDGGVPNDSGGGPLDVNESSGSISDTNGNLLFSTNGIVVLDRNGDIMPNGTGLKGHWSSTQNVVIVPFPGDTEERFYYIFTVGAELGIWNNSGSGLEYVIVDMQENGGMGDVIQPSIELLPNTAEKIHATYHSNNRDLWVVVHEMGSDAFYAFLITCEGIQEPIVSRTGSLYIIDANAVGTIGYLRISHNGPFIASTFNTMQATGEFEANYLEIGTFNHSTGEIAITESIVKPSTGFGTQAYGLEFSSDNSKLYWTRLGSGGGIFQYDLNVSPTAPTEYLVSNATPAAAGMLLAPDGNIYVAHSGGPSYLSRLINSNDAGASVSLEVGIAITNQSKLGLPNNWMYPYPNPEEFEESQTEAIQLCPSTSIVLDPGIANATNYLWNTGETSPTIQVNQPGTYTLTYEISCNSYEYIFVVNQAASPDFELGPDIEICEGEVGQIFVTTEHEVEWYNGQTAHTITVDRAGEYSVTISNDNCEAIASIYVGEKPLPKLIVDEFYEKCNGKTLYLNPSYSDIDKLYLDGFEVDVPIELSAAGSYVITGENACGSIQRVFLLEDVSCTCELFIPNAFTPDGDGLNDLLKPIANCPLTNYRFQIFDRWGALVFQSSNINEGWNGSANNNGYYLPNGVCAYRLNWEANKLGEKTFEQNVGHITLIR